MNATREAQVEVLTQKIWAYPRYRNRTVFIAEYREWARGLAQELEAEVLLVRERTFVDALRAARRRFSEQNGQVGQEVWNDNYEAVHAIDEALKLV